jgi:hypothetical protein
MEPGLTERANRRGAPPDERYCNKAADCKLEMTYFCLKAGGKFGTITCRNVNAAPLKQVICRGAKRNVESPETVVEMAAPAAFCICAGTTCIAADN